MKKTFYAFILCLFLFPAFTFALQNKEISIDSLAHALVAPEATSYQWYRNGEMIQGATEKNLVVKEPGNYQVLTFYLSGKVLSSSASVTVNAAGAIVKIYLIGDSTVCNYKASDYPWTGWGQLFGLFFTTGSVSISNNAIGGRSSRSFYEEGRWTTVRDALKTGDYVFIQFGHNDRDTKPERYTTVADYKNYLSIFCNDAKAKGAIPVLVSPMVLNAWTGSTMRNVFTENGNNYRGGMLEVATALDVAFIDLNMKSWNLYKTYGAAYNTRFIYKGLVAGEYPNYPDGITDGTHFQEMGSLSHGRMISEGIRELAARADMTNLISILKPLYNISATVNPAGSDEMTTKPGTYPQGVTVTLKTLPKTGKTFIQWNNAGSVILSTKTLTTFTQGTTAAAYTARYSGALVTGTDNLKTGTGITMYPNPTSTCFQLVTKGSFIYSIQDLSGKVMESGIGLDEASAGMELAPGAYLISIIQGDVSRVLTAVKR